MSRKQVQFVIVIFLFVLIQMNGFFTEGLFMDGLIYSNIARNIADGSCSFWHLYTTPVYQNPFFEHPPLQMYLQSFFFDVFGNVFWIERLYTLFVSIIICILLIKIWQEIFKDDRVNKDYAYWVVVCLLSIPVYSWSIKSNMLENTMTLFTTASVLFFMYALSARRYIGYSIVATLLIFAAFLTKGFIGLFPFAMMFCYSVLFQNYKRTFLITGLSIFVFLSVFALTLMHSDAFNYLNNYFVTQVITAIKGEEDPVTRFFILKRLFQELIPLFIFILFTLFINKKFWRNKWGHVFFLLALSGSMPVLISQKQSGYYIVPALVFYALAFAIYTIELWKRIIEFMYQKVWINYVLIVLICGGVFFHISAYGHLSRDADMIKDVKQIGSVVPHHSTISSTMSLFDKWSLHGYLYRMYNISYHRKSIQTKYMISMKGELPDTTLYKNMNLNTVSIDLWKQK